MQASLIRRAEAFQALGEDLLSIGNSSTEFAARFEQVSSDAYSYNKWFTVENNRQAAAALGHMLERSALVKWMATYAKLDEARPMKRIGLVMAGNVPMVGFHDLMCVMMAGHQAVVKFSGDDDRLLPMLVERLFEHEPALRGQYQRADGKLSDFDAVIATGGGNTSRYFEYYFGKYPHIIRRNRSSAAVLTGKETKAELEALSRDCMAYFGLGCRNVTKLWIPEGYNLQPFCQVMEAFGAYLQHDKYRNNYDYNKSLLLLNKVPHMDNGVVLMKEDKALGAPVTVLHLEHYRALHDVENRLMDEAAMLQCVVSSGGQFPGSIPFGTTQSPALWDYADQVDTMEFLLTIPA
ncbi:MAG: acyl-CoA reductase [Flavobacteriales bacterium]|nr:acyl-CoA reductase [Flavobacteriales bacterium]MCB9447852.1 acyl-CoA reductase [Flavobacteriales bacterium]